MNFCDIIGQIRAISQLKQAIDSNTLPHALLISGQEGTGGLPLALAAARYLLCENRQTEGVCDTCKACVKTRKYQHPDLHFIFPTINKSTAGISSYSEDYIQDWRQAISDNPYLTLNDWMALIDAENKQCIINKEDAAAVIRHLSVKPYESDYRVMIIWLPEKMNETAANKLLKIIEEPYEKTYFFLVSEDPEHIIGTILSRSQRLNLSPIPESEIAQRLLKELDLLPDEAQQYAHIAQGSWSKALKSISDKTDHDFYFDMFCKMMRYSYARKLREMKDWSEEMSAIGRERQKAYLQYAQGLIRENFIMNFQEPQLNYMLQDENAFSQRFSAFVTQHNVEGIMNELALAETDIMGNVNAKMVFFDLALKMIMLLKNA